MLNIGLSIVQNRVASSLSTAFADFGANPSIIAADADQNALFLSDASTGNVLTSVSLSEFGAPTNGSGFIGFDKSGNAIEYSDGELPRTWDASNNQWIWMTDPAVTRISPLDPNSWPLKSGTTVLTNLNTDDLNDYTFSRDQSFASVRSQNDYPVVAGNRYTISALVHDSSDSNARMLLDSRDDTGVSVFRCQLLFDAEGNLTTSNINFVTGDGVDWGDQSIVTVERGGGWWEVHMSGTATKTGTTTVHGIYVGGDVGSGILRIKALQLTQTDEFHGLVGGDQTVGNVDREALEWTLGSRARAAVQAATNLTVGNAWTQPSASDDERHLFQIDNASTFSVRTSSSGVAEAQAAAGTSSTGTTPAAGGHRIAAAMGSSDLSVSLDGASTVSTAGSASSLSSITTIAVGAAADGSLGVRGGINKIAIAAVDTSNADLEAWSGL